MAKNNYDGLRLNGQFFYCSFPFSLDSWQGCSHNCQYCFSYYNYLVNGAKRGRDFFQPNNPFNYRDLERAFEEEPTTKVQKTFKTLIESKMPIHWGGVSDPFSDFEKNSEDKVSLKCLKLFRKYQYPIIVSTKSRWITDTPEYLDEITGNKNCILQVSLIGINDIIRKIEPGTSIEKRLELIEKISKTNRVVVRLQPYIPIVCDDGLEEFIKTVAKKGAKAMTVEFLKLSSFQDEVGKKYMKELGDNLGYDVLKYYKYKGKMTATDYEIMPQLKKPVLEKIRDLIHKSGMEFYCADNAFRDLGDSPICCGIPVDYPGFENFFRSQASYALFIAKEKGKVSFSDVYGKLRKHEKGFLTHDVGTFLNVGDTVAKLKQEGKTYYDRAMFIWDNPRNPNNPARMFYNLKADKLDKAGHIVYKYEPK